MICPDVLEFQDNLKKMRTFDDKIIYALNTSLPTESFRSKVNATSACHELYSQMQKGHSDRENAIKNCIVATADNVKKLKNAKGETPDDSTVLKNLKAEQRKADVLWVRVLKLYPSFGTWDLRDMQALLPQLPTLIPLV